MSKIEIDEIAVKKHLKVSGKNATVVINTGSHGIGVWFSKKGEPDSNQFSIYAGNDYFAAMYYPPKDFFESGVKHRMPFAISEQGFQYPLPTGGVKMIPLRALVSLLDALSVGVSELIPKVPSVSFGGTNQLATPLASSKEES